MTNQCCEVIIRLDRRLSIGSETAERITALAREHVITLT